jgi:hypothetical protein
MMMVISSTLRLSLFLGDIVNDTLLKRFRVHGRNVSFLINIHSFQLPEIRCTCKGNEWRLVASMKRDYEREYLIWRLYSPTGTVIRVSENNEVNGLYLFFGYQD